MGVERAPSQGSIPRVSVSASVLIVMLLSLPMAAEARGSLSALSAGRIALAPEHVLPVAIAQRLCAGIRYEAEPTPARAEPSADAPVSTDAAARPFAAPLLESLLDLPPPAVR